MAASNVRVVPGSESRRGRPADPGLDDALRRAAAEVLAQRGWRDATVDEIATRAGTARTTVYRRHGSLTGVLLLLMDDIYARVPVPDTGDVRDDLVSLMRDVAAVWRDPAHVRYLSALIAAQHDDARVAAAYQAQFAARRSQTSEIVARAVARGQLPAGTDGELLLDLLAGIAAQRVLLRMGELDEAAVEAAVDVLLDGVRPR